MPRQARIVKPDFPHHIIQRGVRGVQVFSSPNDYIFYLNLLKRWSQEAELEILAYCLMPNHVHIIGTPNNMDSLRLCMSQTHKRYTQMVNKREKSYGHLWQARFLSYPIDDEAYLYSAVRYVENNPVQAKLVSHAENYAWSSAKFHMGLSPSSILQRNFMDERIKNWKGFLEQTEHRTVLSDLQKKSGDSYL